MRLFGPTGARSQWEDRNPTRVNVTEAATSRPGNTDAITWTYTVPANRRARVLHAGEYAVVTTALAVGQQAFVTVQMRPVAAGAIFGMAFERIADAPINTRQKAEVAGAYLVADNVLEGRIFLSVGAGVVTSQGGASIMEYDI